MSLDEMRSPLLQRRLSALSTDSDHFDVETMSETERLQAAAAFVDNAFTGGMRTEPESVIDLIHVRNFGL